MFREGQQIGYYTLVKFLGRGGFGEVWLAENRNVSQPEQVAIKLPQNQQIDLQTVKNEIFNWILSGKHKNILPIIECETFGNQIAIVSEYAPDGSLKDLIERKGRLSIADAAETVTGILEGLIHLHNRKIIHRDLKPENILLQGSTPRLTDFGISRAVTDAGNTSNLIAGTQAYMAPETFDGKRTPQTDIWSVGVIFYLLLSGQLPFPQKETTELIGAIVMHDPPPLAENIPVSLKNIVARALDKNAVSRYQNAAEMLQDVLNASSGLPPNEENFRGNPDTQPFVGVDTPFQKQAAATEVYNAPKKAKSKPGLIILATALAVYLLLGAGIYGVYNLWQISRQNTVGSSSRINTNNGSKEKISPETAFSESNINTAFDEIEKAYGGEIKLTNFMMSLSFASFEADKDRLLASIEAQDIINSENYDSYSYHFDTGRVSKQPMSAFLIGEDRALIFSRKDINPEAVEKIFKKALLRTKEINETPERYTLSVRQTTSDIELQFFVYGVRRKLSLKSDPKGENIKETIY